MNPYRFLLRTAALLPAALLTGCLYPPSVAVGIGGGFGGHSHIGIGTAITIPVVQSRTTTVVLPDRTADAPAVAYFDADGYLVSQPVAGGFRRIVLSNAGGGWFWVQDFYIDDNREYGEPVRLPRDRFYTFHLPDGARRTVYRQGGIVSETRLHQGNTVYEQSYFYPGRTYPAHRPRRIDPRRLIGLSPVQRMQLMREYGVTQEPSTDNLRLTPEERLKLIQENQAAAQRRAERRGF